MLLKTDIASFVKYINLWNRKYELNMEFYGQYDQDAAWIVGNILVTGTEIAPGLILCEFDNFNLDGANDLAKRAYHRLFDLLGQSFSVETDLRASRDYEVMARQAARTLRSFPPIFADVQLDAVTEVEFKSDLRAKNLDVSEQELDGAWQNFCQLVEQQREQRQEQSRRRKMTAKDAIEEWRENVQQGMSNNIKLTSRNRKKWHQNLTQSFDLEDLRILSFEMGIQYENFSDRLYVFAREMIEYCEKHQRIEELRQNCQEKRPKTSW